MGLQPLLPPTIVTPLALVLPVEQVIDGALAIAITPTHPVVVVVPGAPVVLDLCLEQLWLVVPEVLASRAQ